MSSLQKFHRRTNGGIPVVPTFPAIGSGNDTVGYWLGTAGDGSSKLIVVPKSSQTQLAWGSRGIERMVKGVDDGLSNTNILYAYGQSAHPAAYYCKTLTIGGYNTWYLPARNELSTSFNNRSNLPFSTANQFASAAHFSSTEYNGNYAESLNFGTGIGGYWSKSSTSTYVRAVRRTVV